jgi:gas vesicle protein
MSVVSIETKVAVMEDAISRYEDAIAKLVEVSQDLKQMLAVHEIRHQERERAEMTLKNEMDKENNILHGRINDLSRDTKQELDSQYDEIMKMLKAMREESCAHHKKIEDSMTDLKTNEIAPLKNRLSSLERWRWLIVGGGLVIAAILYNIPWQNFIGS